MTLADDLKPVLFEARAIMGQLGFRPYTIQLFLDYQGGAQDFTPITEAGGQPPKLVWEKDEDNPGNAGPEDIVLIGPITPSFSGGGTDFTQLTADVDAGLARWVLITGPRHPDGAKYRITNVDSQKSLRYMIRAQSEGMGLTGYAPAPG